MLDAKYTWDEMELVEKIKFNFAPIQIYEYTKERMADLLEYGLYTNEEFQEFVCEVLDNPLEVLNFDNDNANAGSEYIYTEASKNGYIRGFDTIEEMVDFCIMWLYANGDLDRDFLEFIKFEESKKDGEKFNTEDLSNDYFELIYR